jgi:hypothetical protein
VCRVSLLRRFSAVLVTLNAVFSQVPTARAQNGVVRLPPTSGPSAGAFIDPDGPVARLAAVPTRDDAGRIYAPSATLAAFSRRQPDAPGGQVQDNRTRTSGSEAEDEEPWPNISEPGPDMGDFPNSAFTLPKGGAQIEFSPVTLLHADAQNPAAYGTPFLLRYGATDNVELRMIGFGLVSVGGSSPSTGFAPPKLDMKVHLWNARKQGWLPAASLEVYLTTTWGSPQFSTGWQPSINMNFDRPLTKKLNLEWTVGYSGVQQAVNLRTGEIFTPRFGFLVPGLHRAIDLNRDQFSVSWAFEYEVSDRLQFFFHGAHNGAIALNLGEGDIIGQGMFWKFSRRLVGFASIDQALTPNLPPVAGQLGFAYAL